MATIVTGAAGAAGPADSRNPRPGLRARVEKVLNVVRRIIGVPDYDRYVAHVKTHHPGAEPMCQKDFEKKRMSDKYSQPGGRCC